MFIVYTTEDNLSRLCSEEDNSWYKIIMKIQEVVISTNSPDEIWDASNPYLAALHRAGVKIDSENAFIEQIKTTSPNNVLEDPCGAYLLDIDEKQALDIQTKYGVICQPLASSKNILITKGWTINTADDKPHNWEYIFENQNCPINSVVIVDRYFFSSEVGESISDSLLNLRQILNALLPQHSKDNILQVSLIFDYTTVREKDDITFKGLAEKVNKIKRSVRDYAYDLELISMDANCYLYEETHDRRIIANFSITEATHKLKAFQENNGVSCNQQIIFKRLFEEGLDDKSSVPALSHKKSLEKLTEAVNKESNKSLIDYACNGQETKRGLFNVKNRMLQKRG